MGLFGSSKPKVTKREFKKVLTNLRASDHFSRRDLGRVEQMFSGEMNQNGLRWSGLDKHEIERNVKWLEENKSKHDFSDSQIQALREGLEGKL